MAKKIKVKSKQLSISRLKKLKSEKIVYRPLKLRGGGKFKLGEEPRSSVRRTRLPSSTVKVPKDTASRKPIVRRGSKYWERLHDRSQSRLARERKTVRLTSAIRNILDNPNHYTNDQGNFTKRGYERYSKLRSRVTSAIREYDIRMLRDPEFAKKWSNRSASVFVEQKIVLKAGWYKPYFTKEQFIIVKRVQEVLRRERAAVKMLEGGGGGGRDIWDIEDDAGDDFEADTIGGGEREDFYSRNRSNIIDYQKDFTAFGKSIAGGLESGIELKRAQRENQRRLGKLPRFK